MITEGFFTNDEVSSARQYGAEVHEAKGNRLELRFPTSDKYEAWLAEQQKLHPNRWADSVRISIKN